MKRNAFRQWMGGLGIAAALLLVLVPGVGRMAQAASGVRDLHAAHAHHAHGGAIRDVAHATAAFLRTGDGATPERIDRRAAIGDPDCDYCPLLASLAIAPGVAFVLAHAPAAAGPAAPSAAPRLRWRHPWGLGSRGPP